MKSKNGLKPKVPPVPAGTYRGRLVHVIDIGEQLVKGKKGDYYQNQVVFTFELIGKTQEVDGKIVAQDLSRTFGYTSGENSAFRKFVQDWTGVKFSNDTWAEFNPGTLLNKEAMVGVVHNESGEYANIANAMQPLEGDVYPEATLPLLHFDLDEWDEGVIGKLPDWAKDRLEKSTQYQKNHAPETTVEVKAPEIATSAAPPRNDSEGECPI